MWARKLREGLLASIRRDVFALEGEPFNTTCPESDSDAAPIDHDDNDPSPIAVRTTATTPTPVLATAVDDQTSRVDDTFSLNRR